MPSYNGGVTKYILPNTALAVGHYTYPLTPIVADNAGGISVVAKAYTANNVRVSAVLLEVKG